MGFSPVFCPKEKWWNKSRPYLPDLPMPSCFDSKHLVCFFATTRNRKLDKRFTSLIRCIPKISAYSGRPPNERWINLLKPLFAQPNMNRFPNLSNVGNFYFGVVAARLFFNRNKTCFLETRTTTNKILFKRTKCFYVVKM